MIEPSAFFAHFPKMRIRLTLLSLAIVIQAFQVTAITMRGEPTADGKRLLLETVATRTNSMSGLSSQPSSSARS